MSLDVYETRSELCLELCKTLKGLYPNASSFLEPSAGSGNFVDAIRKTWMVPGITIDACEIREECRALLNPKVDSLGILDFLTDVRVVVALKDIKYDLVIGNPPFKQGTPFILRCLDLVTSGTAIAFLLPVAYLATKERCDGVYKKHPLRYYASIWPRPDFIYDGMNEGHTARAEYGLFVWEKGFQGRGEILPPIHWER